MSETLFCAPGFALQLRLACAHRNLSQRSAATLAGVSAATFNRIAAKECPPDIETYHRLKRWLEPADQPDCFKGDA